MPSILYSTCMTLTQLLISYAGSNVYRGDQRITTKGTFMLSDFVPLKGICTNF